MRDIFNTIHAGVYTVYRCDTNNFSDPNFLSSA